MTDWAAEADKVVRATVRGFVLECDQAGMDRFIVEMAARVMVNGVRWSGSDLIVKDLTAMFTEEVAAAPHDVQVWWLGECNCDGHLN